MASNASSSLETLLRERILILDGAMGTMIQGFGLTEADFRGTRFADHPDPLAGNNDLLCLTRPDVIEDIHRQFLLAGADIVETNTFNSTLAPQSDYNTESLVYEINVAAAKIARAAAVSVETPEKPRFVAGAMGPTNRSLSLSPKVEDPAFRAMRFDAMAESYAEQARGLLDGGVDLLLVETAFDTLNLKSALAAIEAVFADKGVRVPIMLSTTITDASGRTLSGQTIEAFWTSVAHAEALAVGINCALGPKDMRPHIEALSRIARTNIICYPNAGLPNAFGEYDLKADKMASFLGAWAEEGWLNVAGGCCGTTPAHIKAIAEAAAKAEPRRKPPAGPVFSRFSGMEMLEIRPESNFIVIGERTNVTGSRKFARLIRTGDYEGAVSVARHQVEGGANILDINMDEGLLDSEAVMEVFLNLLAGEPDVARLPFMLDSSRFSVIEAGLKCVQGKAVVNSISLKEGEEVFKAQARTVLGYGAAVVVMAFDEEGQAVDVDRKVAILSRAHKILIEEVGFAPQDIFFDPNILTVATGIEEHNGYGVAFIEATRQLKQKFPQAKVIGGVSNVSFSFRGNNRVREAMHSAFLYHAIRAGMAGGIVNAGQIVVYDEIEPDLLEAVEDVILNRRPDATERLVELAERFKGQKRDPAKAKAWRSEPLAARLSHALVHGLTEHMDEDVAEAIEAYDKPLDIIEGPLMAGMSVVGDLFGAGKMFLPQVVKSARAMKKAVAILEPLMDAEREGTGATSQGKILMATVKGDVHDIGKNIVGVVLGCNGYEIIDLGVMVPAAKILATARERKVDAIGLSGLITPSLDEMVHVARELQREGFDIPLLIGGATTSRRHTSVKIAPGYDHTTVHVLDASRAATVVGTLLDPNRRPAFDTKNRGLQARDRDIHSMRRASELVTLEDARANAPNLPFDTATCPQPAFTGRQVIESVPLEALVPLIDWTPFFVTWELRGRYPAILDHPKMGAAARDLFANAKAMLDEIVSGKLLQAKAVYGFYEAKRDGDDIHLSEHGDPRTTLHMLRQQRAKKGGKPHRSLADYIAPADAAVPDWMGAFAVTTGIGLDAIVARYEADHDDYNAILAKALADRLAEACAEWLHKRAREDWGFGKTEDIDVDGLIKEDYRGIRPAPGYPACPDHTEKPALFDLLGVTEATTIALTESLAMTPAASVCGWLLAHPEARYFNIGPLGRDQVADYATRKGMRLEEAERWLSPSLGYEP